MNTKDLINKCYKLSIENLLLNTTEHGLLAARAVDTEGKSKNYTSLFSRDIGVCSIGILSTNNEKLLAALKTSLESLIKAQSSLGQFPFYSQPENNIVRWWMPGALDSTIWWCIAFLLYFQKTKDKVFYDTHKDALDKAFLWLQYQDTNNDKLLEQGEAADWADEMPRLGTVLYSNTLWYYLVTLRIRVEEKKELEPLREKIYEGFNTLLWIHKFEDNTLNYVPRNNYTKENIFADGVIESINAQVVYLPYYLGYVSHKTYEMRCDTYGNILACLTDLADKTKKTLIADSLLRAGTNLPYPIKALYPPIYPGEPDWKQYMTKGRQDYPWQYHNGGIWPYIGGFWVMMLAKNGMREQAEKELYKLAEANSLNGWEFNEFLHGQHGTPMGIPYQSWNMAMYIAAYNSVYNNVSLF